MLEKLKQLLDVIDNKLMGWASKVKLLVEVLKQLLSMVPDDAPPPPPLVLAATADQEAAAASIIKSVVKQLEQPDAVNIAAIGDGTLLRTLLPILVGLLRKWIGV